MLPTRKNSKPFARYTTEAKASFLLAGFFLLLTHSACKKFVDIDPPVNGIVAASVFASDQTATAAITGLYSELMSTNNQLLNGGTTLYTALSGDELTYNGFNSSLQEVAQNSMPASSSIARGNLWRAGYSTIYGANAAIEGLTGSSALTPTLRNQLLGEARLLRALAYFYLANILGDVPLVLTTDYKTNSLMGRTPSADIYAQMISDLKEAQQLLQVSYPTAGKVRPNKWAATALLARVYLYTGDWAAAEAEADAVIGSGSYSLAANLNTVFLSGSPEAIWQFQPVVTSAATNTFEGFNFIPSSASVIPSYTVSPYLLAAFEPGDGRKAAWLKANTVNSQPYYHPYKYKTRTGAVNEYYIVLRLAEQYLVRAEARAQQNKLPEGENDLNVIRNRAGLPDTTTSDKAALLAAIERERQVELAFEWGHRWFDLKRTGRIDAVLGSRKNGWQNSRALFPLPLTELELNPFLTQNPGY